MNIILHGRKEIVKIIDRPTHSHNLTVNFPLILYRITPSFQNLWEAVRCSCISWALQYLSNEKIRFAILFCFSSFSNDHSQLLLIFGLDFSKGTWKFGLCGLDQHSVFFRDQFYWKCYIPYGRIYPNLEFEIASRLMCTYTHEFFFSPSLFQKRVSPDF